MNRQQKRAEEKFAKKRNDTIRKIKRPMIAIGIPAKDFVYRNFAISFANMLVWSFKWIDMQVIGQDSPTISFNRNRMVYDARKMSADYILMLDSDEEIDRLALLKLFSHRKDIVVADYPKRTKPYPAVNPKPLEGESGDLVRLPWAATGCMLIKMSAFDKIEFPWFLSGYDENNQEFGEDQYFTKKAIQGGFEVWQDNTIKIGHGVIDYKYL